MSGNNFKMYPNPKFLFKYSEVPKANNLPCYKNAILSAKKLASSSLCVVMIIIFCFFFNVYNKLHILILA